MHSTFSSTHTGTSQKCTRLAPVSMHFSQYRNLSISAFCKNVNKAARKNLSNILISGHIKTSSTYVFIWQNLFLPLRLFSDISEDASVHIEDVSIYKVRSLGREEHCRSLEVFHGAPSCCRCLRNDKLVERMTGAVSLTFS